MPRVALTTLGCKVNQVETDAIQGLFVNLGYSVVPFTEPADIYIINTCSVTHLGERKSRQLIRRAVRQNADAVVAVTGCYAQISPEEVSGIAGVDVVIGTQDRGNIVSLVEAAVVSKGKINAVSDIMTAEHFEDIPFLAVPGRTRAFLKIQEGCTNYCTYCIIPYARGRLRSRSLESIAKEAHKIVDAGFKEIVLTGIHLGAYGRDCKGDITLTDAIRQVLAEDKLLRLRLSSLETMEVTDELILLIKNDSRFCRHLHLPLQAGDDRVLEAMNRRYSTDEYKQAIAKIRQEMPDIAISTDIIVGFPGETEEMFQNALAFVSSMNFSSMHIFPYSRRSGTPAAQYLGQIPEEEKRRRVEQMQKIASEMQKKFIATYIGRNMDVLFEVSPKEAEGYTDNYIRVYTSSKINAGTICSMTMEKIHDDGLWGTMSC